MSDETGETPVSEQENFEGPRPAGWWDSEGRLIQRGTPEEKQLAVTVRRLREDNDSMRAVLLELLSSFDDIKETVSAVLGAPDD